MTSEEIEAIERRAGRASAGPWRSAQRETSGNWSYLEITDGDGHTVASTSEIDGPGADWDRMDRDALFIAAARTDVPALLAEVRALTELAELNSAWSRFWKRAAKRYRLFIHYKWTERCVELKTEAITMDRDVLRTRVAHLEADNRTLTELADAALAVRTTRRALAAASEYQVSTKENYDAKFAARIANEEAETRFVKLLDAYEARKAKDTL